MTLKKFERIPYLDGLRAISIAAVLLGHSANSIQRLHTPASRALRILINPEVGVRVFFVISGFIITTLLLQELENTKKIDILGFYQRRIARIFPAFYTYVIVVLLLKLCGAATLTWPPLIAAATYTWNYAYFWGATTEKGKLLLEHSWTLSLEEQFYLLWPACLLFLNSKIAK